jgi:hypothetical protein
MNAASLVGATFMSLEFNSNFPPIVDINGLSVLLAKKTAVINIDRYRRPHTLPPACTPPDTRKPLWVVSDVIAWLRQFEEHKKTDKKLGAPTKSEQIAKRNAKNLSLNNA